MGEWEGPIGTFLFVFFVFSLLSFFGVLKKAGYEWRHFFIDPFILTDLAGLSRWYPLTILIPIINIFCFFYLFYRIAVRFGISRRGSVLFSLFPWVLFPYIALSIVEYQPDNPVHVGNCLRFKWRTTLVSCVTGLFVAGGLTTISSEYYPVSGGLLLYFGVHGLIVDIKQGRKGGESQTQTIVPQAPYDYLYLLAMVAPLPTIGLYIADLIPNEVYLLLLRLALLVVCVFIVVVIKTYPRLYWVAFKRARRGKRIGWIAALAGVLLVLVTLPSFDCFLGQRLFASWWSSEYYAVAYMVALLSVLMSAVLYGNWLFSRKPKSLARC